MSEAADAKLPSVREIPLARITVDPEFQSLLSPLTSEELAQLEANLLDEGLRDPLIVWLDESFGKSTRPKFLLLDGHNRFEICTKHKDLLIAPDGEEGECVMVCFVDLPDREAAKLWILENQVGKRNLTDDQRAIIWAEILERRTKVSRGQAPAKARSAKAEPAVAAKTSATEKRDTRAAVAKEARLPEKKLRAARDLKKEDPALAQEVRDGKKTIREANAELGKKAASDIDRSTPETSTTAQNGMFELLSALQKSVRRGDEREALLAAWQLDAKRGRQNYGGQMWSVLRRICAEDVGLACIRVVEPIETLWRFWEKQVKSLGSKHEPWRLFTVEAVLILCRTPKSRLVDHASVAIDKDRLQAIADEVRQAPQPHPIPEYAHDGKHTGTKNGKTTLDFIVTEDSALIPKATDVEDPYKQQILDAVKPVAPSTPEPKIPIGSRITVFNKCDASSRRSAILCRYEGDKPVFRFLTAKGNPKREERFLHPDYCFELESPQSPAIASPVTDLAKPRSLSSLRREMGEIVRRAQRLGWYKNITRRLKIPHTIVMNESGVRPEGWKKGSDLPFTDIEIENIRKLVALYKQKASAAAAKPKRFKLPKAYQLSADERALANEMIKFPNIRSGFCALVRLHHPDYGGSNEKFQAVMRAYAYLKQHSSQLPAQPAATRKQTT